mgnify:CR=1 FL=1
MPITPIHWGEFKWLSMHVTCYYIDTVFGRNLERQRTLHGWLQSSAEMLPCGECEHHFKSYLTSHPLPAVQVYPRGETPYLRWSIRAHNSVRRRQRKPLADEETVIATYKSGQIYGGKKSPSSPMTSTPTSLSADPSAAEDLVGSGYKIATYVLGAILGTLLLGLMIRGILHLTARHTQGQRRQVIPKLADY